MKLHHGTSKSMVESIVRGGLRTDYAGRTYDRTPAGIVFLAATRKEARRYADAAFGRANATVVTVNLPDDWPLQEHPVHYGLMSAKSIPADYLSVK